MKIGKQRKKKEGKVIVDELVRKEKKIKEREMKEDKKVKIR